MYDFVLYLAIVGIICGIPLVKKYFFTKTVSLDDFKLPDGFAEYYQDKIEPQNFRFEKLRRQYLKKYWLRLFIYAAIIIFAVYYQMSYMQYIPNDMLRNYSIIFMLFIMVGGYFVLRPVFEYNDIIKDKVFPLIFSFFGNKLTYKHSTNYKVTDLKDFGIIPYYENEETEDEIVGTHNDVSVHMVQTTLMTTQNERLNYNQLWRNVTRNKKVIEFSGLLIVLGMNKNFSCQIIIRKDRGMFFEALDGLFAACKIVRLEDVEFEKMFSVYSNDQIGVRYILTTGFMERLLKLNKSFGNRNLEASFLKNKLLIKIDSDHKWFVPASLFRKVNFLYDSKMVLYKLSIIFDIIETLKLDRK